MLPLLLYPQAAYTYTPGLGCEDYQCMEAGVGRDGVKWGSGVEAGWSVREGGDMHSKDRVGV